MRELGRWEYDDGSERRMVVAGEGRGGRILVVQESEGADTELAFGMPRHVTAVSFRECEGVSGGDVVAALEAGAPDEVYVSAATRVLEECGVGFDRFSSEGDALP